jgi:hypothetical protein
MGLTFNPNGAVPWSNVLSDGPVSVAPTQQQTTISKSVS